MHPYRTSLIRLIGPGGAGKSTVGALVAARLGTAFIDLDRRFEDGMGDISVYISRFGYNAYARDNVEAYCSFLREGACCGVAALSSAS
jgi:shikimate kinase